MNALWIGGSTCAWKTTVAKALAKRHGLAVYHVDEHEAEHVARHDPTLHPTYARWIAMTASERWAESSVDELVDDTRALVGERFPMIVDDIRSGGAPVIVEGFQVYPSHVVRVLDSPRRAVFLVCTPRFRRERHYARPHARQMPNETSDPERAQANRLDRDDRVGEEVAAEARALGLKLVEVDGSRGVHEIIDEVEAWFRPYLPLRS